MPTTVITLPIYSKVEPAKGRVVVSTVSSAPGWNRELSPFVLGPVGLYVGLGAWNVENAWQYSKVYPQHWNGSRPKMSYWQWALEGWHNKKAVRYPMGKGARPVCSWWRGKALTYVQARKAIYGPLYAEAVMKTPAWDELVFLYETKKELILLDYDVRDTRITGESMSDVMNNQEKKMGHAFVLKMLLTNDPALKQMNLRS